ncbi:metallophosphoesterase family protein [Sandaracinobacteroides hominis]|uniref:metallophosphoesterase family protein n=1 Tax=Sandaracinobacteroides hominis TaxID=2780086 RepID=UPI0018F7465A|nr:metallophosphoesterase [Sandaracinobacteroides hominis]
MTRIAHLSDIHFGAHNPKIVSATEAWLEKRRPDLVVISGDLTQRARVSQFREASGYLNRLRHAGLKLLAIPGNHDIPLYDIIRRFGAPLDRYKRFVSNDLVPWFEDDDVAVLGINTARSLTIKGGRINQEQLALIRERFRLVPEQKTRILVTHHPLFAMPIGKGSELSEAVGGHENAVSAAREAGVHIALAGHFHRTYAESASSMAENLGASLVIQAGTATSTRLRNDEPQSFNWLHVERRDRISLQVIAWNGTSFSDGAETLFTFKGNRWKVEDISGAHQFETGQPLGA